jgi:2-haloacid dehalogenase
VIGEPSEGIVHVAQSLYHDHVPAAKLGLRSVWINRRAGVPGTGATPPVEARPTLTYPSMATFADSLNDRPTRR